MCANLLLTLLALGDPMQVDENNIKLAIDLLARDLNYGEEFTIPNLDSETRRALLILLNEHPDLTAIVIDGGRKIVVRR